MHQARRGGLFIPRPTVGTGATHLPAAPYSSQGGELKTGGKVPLRRRGVPPPAGRGGREADGVGMTVFLIISLYPIKKCPDGAFFYYWTPTLNSSPQPATGWPPMVHFKSSNPSST